MTKGKQTNAKLKALIAVMGIKLDKLEAANVLLENKVEGLESRMKISENVTEKLSVAHSLIDSTVDCRPTIEG